MAMRKYILLAILSLIIAAGGVFLYLSRPDIARLQENALEGREPKFTEPRKQIIPTVGIAKPVGWAKDAAPVPAKGLKVNRFFAGLDHPRNLLLLPNGDVLVAETNSPPRPKSSLTDIVMGWFMGQAGADAPSANRIALLRDSDGDGVADQHFVLLKGLNSPQGMALVGDTLYVANTDSLVAVPYKEGDTQITAKPRKIANLPASAPNYHWGRDLVANADGTKLYVAVGSNSNIAENGIENEDNRAAVLEIDLKKGEAIIYASGLRNPTALAWNPWNRDLWGVVNERDMLGSDMPPDYLTQVDFGAFYGWPWNYWGGYIDKRVTPERSDLREYTKRPDFALGAHTAPLGLAFAADAKLGGKFTNGAFVALHGSWNREPPSGYKLVFVPFGDNGYPLKTAKPVDLLTGFLGKDGKTVQGRPVGVITDAGGALLVADDVGNMIWRVSSTAGAPIAGAPAAK